MSRGDERLNAFFKQLQADLDIALSKSDDPNVRFAVSRQKDRMRKRALVNRPELSGQAIDRFKVINSEVGDTQVTTNDDILQLSAQFIEHALENYTTSVHEWCIQEDFDFLILLDLWKFGPGASFGTKAKHPAEKMDEKWSCTARSVGHVLKLRRHHPYLGQHDQEMGYGVVQCNGSKLATVPKNEERERTIAIEPVGNMVLQLAAGSYIQYALRLLGLDITTQQEKNKLLARSGSITGLLATLDLKDASDRIPIDLVRRLFPKRWSELLEDLRSPLTVLPDGSELKLNMVSTMGNGFTFPLMTLIIASLLYGMLRRNNRTRHNFLNWNLYAVYGDDVILPTKYATEFTSVLESAGFVVNKDKSFLEGPFRESCGGDYHEGYDVTPFYVKSLTHNSGVYVAINQLLDWSARHNVWLTQSLELLGTYLDSDPFFVPEWCDPSWGIRTTQVTRKYNTHQPKAYHAPYKGEYGMSLACGGYLIPRGDRLFYAPRQYKTRYVTKALRLPRGYLNGRDPTGYSPDVSHGRDLRLVVSGLIG